MRRQVPGGFVLLIIRRPPRSVGSLRPAGAFSLGVGVGAPGAPGSGASAAQPKAPVSKAANTIVLTSNHIDFLFIFPSPLCAYTHSLVSVIFYFIHVLAT